MKAREICKRIVSAMRDPWRNEWQEDDGHMTCWTQGEWGADFDLDPEDRRVLEVMFFQHLIPEDIQDLADWLRAETSWSGLAWEKIETDYATVDKKGRRNRGVVFQTFTTSGRLIRTR